MGARNPLVLALSAAALGLGLIQTGCGASVNELNVVEGEKVQLGELSYNIQISRFLNPADQEDKAYLSGQPPLPNDKQWLGVFMQIHNSADTVEHVARDFVITDTQGHKYSPVPSKSDFALRLGGPIPADGDLPEPESAAANGPTQGAMLLFEVDEGANENRPLELEIPSSGGETGRVTLDI